MSATPKYYNYPDFLKLLEEKEAEGLKPIFAHPPRYARTRLADIPGEVLNRIYDELAIKIMEPSTVNSEYFTNLYPIKPYKPEPTDTNMWLKANPFVDVTQKQVILVKFE